MASVKKIDSNITSLRYSEEESIGVLTGSPVWRMLEPNTYADFGGAITTVSRNPINPSRQRKKGVITDLESSAGFNIDLTQVNLQDLLQGYFFADLRTKGELAVPTVNAVDDAFEPASGGGFYHAGDLLFAKGFSDAVNNGLHVVTGSPVSASVEVLTPLIPATGETGTISCVGIQAGDAELGWDSTGDWPRLVRNSGTIDFTDYGLVAGEWIYVGGDTTIHQFSKSGNNGFVRVHSVGAAFIEVDKTSGNISSEPGTGSSIRIFFGRVLKNETGAAIKRRSYQLEMNLGEPDDASSDTQAQYLEGMVPGEFTLNIASADKINCDMVFQGIDTAVATAGNLRAGTRPDLQESDAFNTSTDFTRIKMALYVEGLPLPLPLFAYVTEVTLTINNNLNPDKAVSVLGAFDISAGTFEVSGSMTAYFTNVRTLEYVRNNRNVTFDMHLVKDNSGISIDMPLLGLGDARPNVEQDNAVTVPIEFNAFTGARLNPDLDHTLLAVFFDYLPNAAEVSPELTGSQLDMSDEYNSALQLLGWI